MKISMFLVLCYKWWRSSFSIKSINEWQCRCTSKQFKITNINYNAEINALDANKLYLLKKLMHFKLASYFCIKLQND